jgi:hypothetical protein
VRVVHVLVGRNGFNVYLYACGRSLPASRYSCHVGRANLRVPGMLSQVTCKNCLKHVQVCAHGPYEGSCLQCPKAKPQGAGT